MNFFYSENVAEVGLNKNQWLVMIAFKILVKVKKT